MGLSGERQDAEVKKSTQLSAIGLQTTKTGSRKLISDSGIRYYSFCSFILFFAFINLSSCTDSFQALEENDQYYFSMYGFLDASADTQWVRVTPAREQLDALEEVPDMTVTVENLDNGDTIVLKDSLFQNRGASY